MLEAFSFSVNVSAKASFAWLLQYIAALLFVLMPLLNVCPNIKSVDAIVRILKAQSVNGVQCDTWFTL